MKKTSKLLYVCFTIAPLILAFFLKRRKKELICNSTPDQEEFYYENIFFLNNKLCRDHVIVSNPCNKNCPQRKLAILVDFIGSAKHSIDICVLTLQLLNIYQELVKAHERGMRVRIILDKEMISAKAPRLLKLKSIGTINKNL